LYITEIFSAAIITGFPAEIRKYCFRVGIG